MGKSAGAKGSAQHLARWMRGQLGDEQSEPLTEHEPPEPPEPDLWSVDTLNRRSEELRLTATTTIPLRGGSRCEDLELSDGSLSRSRSTTDGSQVSPILVPSR